MVYKVTYLFNGHIVDEKQFYSRLFMNINDYNKTLSNSQLHFKLIHYLDRLDKNGIVIIPIRFTNSRGIISDTMYENQYERIITKT